MIPESLLTIRETDTAALLGYLSLSQTIKKNPLAFQSTLKGKTILQFFVENSTRTRMSFEAATRKLGGTSIGFSAGTSSLSKGETLLDTVQSIVQYGVDGIVMRHGSSGSPRLVANATQKTLVNAGDGAHEHPTQALLDAVTLAEHWNISFAGKNPFAGKTILILGDTLHSRVARSNIHLLSKLGARVLISGPKTLTIKNFELFPKTEFVDFPDLVLPEADAVMTLRIQTERQAQGLIPSKEEYRHFWGLTAERAKRFKKNVAILHPGPMNRGVEIDFEVADASASLVLKQVENAVFVRMAVLAKLMGGIET
jgi:aspartate carbamoyltransferase catalytic subunit